jgi:hypothetical protein
MPERGILKLAVTAVTIASALGPGVREDAARVE